MVLATEPLNLAIICSAFCKQSLKCLQVHVAIVTAAGYPGEADRFEERVSGLLAAFQRQKLPRSFTDR